MNSEKSLIIIRGLPGCGKTTLASLLSEEGKYPCFSIDDFFTDRESGEYTFKHSENYLAYKNCEENTEKAMINNMPKIILDNCFTLEWEMEFYFRTAKKYDYSVFVLTLENRHGGLNQHSISIEQIKKMAENYKVVLY